MRSATGPQQTIGTRYPVETVEAVEADRKRLGLELSEWMRMAVARTLQDKVTRTEAEPYKRRSRVAAAS